MAKIKCLTCGKTYEVLEGEPMTCVFCGSNAVEVVIEKPKEKLVVDNIDTTEKKIVPELTEAAKKKESKKGAKNGKRN